MSSKPVRITIDLTPEMHRQLTDWVRSAAAELDIPRVSLADAVRSMIAVAAEEPGKVMAQLRRDRGWRSRDEMSGLFLA